MISASRSGVGCSTRTYKLRRRIGSPSRRSSLLVITTNGMLLASTVPNSGIESCHAERISSSRASKPSSTLSSSSINSTQGFSHSSARIRGPGRKKSRPFKLACNSRQLPLSPFPFENSM